MKKLKWILVFATSYLFLGMSDGCSDEDWFRRYEKTNYKNIVTTKAEIILDYRVMDDVASSRAYIFLYEINSNGIFLIDSMKQATLELNGEPLVFGEIDGDECFYPGDPFFSLHPDSTYHVTITDNTGVYDCKTVVPPEFQSLNIPDTMDISQGINLAWSNPYPSYKVHVYVEAYNPTDRSEKVILVDEYLSQFTNIKVPNSLSPFINGWYGIIKMKREHAGMCSLAMHEESEMMAYSSYTRQFVIDKK